MIPTRRRDSMSHQLTERIKQVRPGGVPRPSFFVRPPGGSIMPAFTTRPLYLGRRGLLAAGHYLAARAGQRMFDKGGNAIDAVVATGFALNLLKPHLNGL